MHFLCSFSTCWDKITQSDLHQVNLLNCNIHTFQKNYLLLFSLSQLVTRCPHESSPIWMEHYKESKRDRMKRVTPNRKSNSKNLLQKNQCTSPRAPFAARRMSNRYPISARVPLCQRARPERGTCSPESTSREGDASPQSVPSAQHAPSRRSDRRGCWRWREILIMDSSELLFLAVPLASSLPVCFPRNAPHEWVSFHVDTL